MSSALLLFSRVIGRRRTILGGLRRSYITYSSTRRQLRGIYGASALLGISTMMFAMTPKVIHADEAARGVAPTAPQGTSDQRVQKLVSDSDQSLQMEAENESEEGAYNPDTGEINWECPCLGGMAHGPCGEEFRNAFACFVHSDAEPKGIECIDRFKLMQDCFRRHPDVYAGELAEDATEEAAEEAMPPVEDGATEDSSSLKGM